MCGFIAQLVEQRTGNAEVTGSNPVEALIFFFQASSFQLLKLENLRFSGFQVTGMMEGFVFWFEILDSGIFLGWKIWQVFFWVA